LKKIWKEKQGPMKHRKSERKSNFQFLFFKNYKFSKYFSENKIIK
jgi:hypothetical protein